MEDTASLPLERSVSQQSAASARSSSGGGGRSTTVRGKRKLSSQQPLSSSASSVAATDDDKKSLTSFPSLSPQSPRTDMSQSLPEDYMAAGTAAARPAAAAAAVVDGAAALARWTAPTQQQQQRSAPPLFDDDGLAGPLPIVPIGTTSSGPARAHSSTTASALSIPGALHAADDAHISRLVARHGAVRLVRQLAEDLARRDAQMSALRRRADEREGALRRVAMEVGGLTNLDLETRLREVEREVAERRRAAAGGGGGRGSGEGEGGGGLGGDGGVQDLIDDALRDDDFYGGLWGAQDGAADATIRARSRTATTDTSADGASGATGRAKGWKDFLFGGGAGKTSASSRASSMNGDAATTGTSAGTAAKHNTVVRALQTHQHTSGLLPDRRAPLQDDLFNPPLETDSLRSGSSRASSLHDAPAPSGGSSASGGGGGGGTGSGGGAAGAAGRKASTSLASLALRLVAGNATNDKGGEGTGDLTGAARGRANSANQAVGLSTKGPAKSSRAPSSSSARTAGSRAVSSQGGGPKALMAMRRQVTGGLGGGGGGGGGGGNGAGQGHSARGTQQQQHQQHQQQARWEVAMAAGQPTPDAALLASGSPRQESYGPVEMDTILPPEIQPPTLTHIYSDYNKADYLTDRFGFIYDQRRKKRQREAANMARHIKKGSRTELITNGRAGLSPGGAAADDEAAAAETRWDAVEDSRPDSPASIDTANTAGTTTTATTTIPDDGKPKRWQDYLKIATFPTELLSHTPSISSLGIEVTEGREPSSSSSSLPPKSPGINTEDRGFVPSASTPVLAVDNETAVAAGVESEASRIAANATAQAKDDPEPVKLLLQQLSEVHDALQREKTVRWNDFLRKVRAERRREGEAAAAAANAANAAAAASGNHHHHHHNHPMMRGTAAMTVMPEEKLADGEVVGIAGLGHKGKVGRAKWNEFRGLVLGGIPVAYRAKVWTECSGAGALRVPGYYDDLAARPAADDDAAVAAQIQMDVRRTLTDNIFFRKGPGVAKLGEVLRAYSRRNPDVGYCQGMNLIAANLLLITPSAEDAFWILASIVENILPPAYYDHSLLASRADQQVLRQYVAEVLPRLSAHLDDLAVELEALTFQWFLSVFTDCLSAEALFRVWDVVLCSGAAGAASQSDGGTFLFQVALALLKLNEAQLLACDAPAKVYTYIGHHMTNHAISIDGLINASDALRRLVRKEDVDARRQRAMDHERETMRKREEHSRALRLSRAKNQKAAAAAATAKPAAAAAAAAVVPAPPAPPAEAVTTPLTVDTTTSSEASSELETDDDADDAPPKHAMTVRTPVPLVEE